MVVLWLRLCDYSSLMMRARMSKNVTQIRRRDVAHGTLASWWSVASVQVPATLADGRIQSRLLSASPVFRMAHRIGLIGLIAA